MKGHNISLENLLIAYGYDIVKGENATLNAIKEVADQNSQPLCSGYGGFPDGRKCKGCDDCKKMFDKE